MSRATRTAIFSAPPTVPWRVPPIAGWHDAGSLKEVFVGDDEGRLRADERSAAARRVATLNGQRGLADTYRALGESDAPSPRLAAILRYVDRFAEDPRAIRGADIRALEAVDLSIADIAALTRLVAFVTYQARLLDAFNLIEPET